MRFVEPSGFVSNAIGLTPRSKSMTHAVCSVWASMIVAFLPAMLPATTYRPSGVTYVLWTAPLTGMLFDALQRDRIDHVDRARFFADGHVDSRAIAACGDVVGVSAQPNLVRNPQRSSVDDIECRVGFVADIDPAAVGRRGGPMTDLDPGDPTDDLVRHRIDHMDIVPGAVGLDDADLTARCA